ncbi:FHA domain-containing protein [Phormidium yuhuli AB48]|uniref:FHA domain-containing protein n=1 Tax=Phormidium yuhuli AB48 TaxID=2940671 RepID=A0ABY5ATD0_9CYAN|nr:FHA domain-containing protein [Phormidium yuhuli]USR91398.1 FHA domain-containing protein [Phormidium yuhuli AB48]
MITLTLLHPHQSIPLKRWTFEDDIVVRIGRAPDNHVVLYSAVVSRYHLELHCDDKRQWYLVNLGTNGTYLEDSPIEEIPATDGSIVRLARTGPQIQLHVSKPPPVSPAQKLLKHLQDRGTPDEDTTSEESFPPATQVVQESSPEVSSD